MRRPIRSRSHPEPTSSERQPEEGEVTSTTLDVTRPEITTKGWARVLAAVGGLGLVAGLIMLMVSPASDDTGETPAEVVSYASSHEGWNIAILLFGLASVALGGLFVAGLHSRLRRVATETESALVLIGGIVFTLCFALCWVIWMAPLADMPDDPARALAQAEAYLGYDDVGWFLLGDSRGRGGALHRPGLDRRDPRRASRLARLARRRRGHRVARRRSRSSACSRGWRGSPSRRSCCSSRDGPRGPSAGSGGGCRR